MISETTRFHGTSDGFVFERSMIIETDIEEELAKFMRDMCKATCHGTNGEKRFATLLETFEKSIILHKRFGQIRIKETGNRTETYSRIAVDANGLELEKSRKSERTIEGELSNFFREMRKAINEDKRWRSDWLLENLGLIIDVLQRQGLISRRSL